MKKIILSSLLLASSSLATTYEYPYLYKEPRALGMGGAYIAVGGTSSSVFYNPAGLSNINKKAGWEVNLLKLSIGWGKNSINFYNDIMDAIDAQDGDYVQPPDGDDADDQAVAINRVIKAYQGENLHLNVNNYSSVSKKFDKFAFTLGLLIDFTNNTIPHQGFGITGVIEEHISLTYGPILGFSYDFTKYNLALGASIKYMHREAVDHYFTTREIIEHEDNLDTYITETLKKTGSDFSGDLGILYKVDNLPYTDISFGVSALNIGDLDFGEAGKIPATINAGIAFKPHIPIFDWTFALDIVDITKNFEQDEDWIKRIRAGMEVGLLDRWWGGLKLRAGIYQSYLTAGAELRLFLLTAMFTTYEEEVGAYGGQKGDRRYLATLVLGW